MNKTKFDIQGMTCSSCQAHVEKAVKKLDGVNDVSVNLLSNNMVVNYDENVLNENKIIEAVTDAGYGASIIGISKNNIKKDNKETTEDVIKSMKNRLIISIIFLIPLMYIAMHNMLFKYFGLPVPSIIKSLFDGPENAITFAFSQFLILLPIVYVNRTYFIIGFKRLFKKSPNMDSLIAIGSSASIIYGIYTIFMIGYNLGQHRLNVVSSLSHDIYFESAGTILTLITVRKIFRDKIKRENK